MEYKKLPLDENGKLMISGFKLQSPTDLTIISAPKSGKTLSMVNVPKFLIGDLEGGTDYFGANNVVNLTDYDGAKEFQILKDGTYVPMGLYQAVAELRVANRMKDYWKLREELDSRQTPKERELTKGAIIELINTIPFPIFVTDTVTTLQEPNKKAALACYNDIFMIPKGKDPKLDITKVDEYSGVQYTRANMAGIKRFVDMNAAPFKIWTGHIKEKKKVLDKKDENIAVVDMALDGVQPLLFTSKAAAVSIFYRTEEGCFLDFGKKGPETDLGSRAFHLSNKVIKIADTLKSGEMYPTTHWKTIFPEVEF